MFWRHGYPSHQRSQLSKIVSDHRTGL